MSAVQNNLMSGIYDRHAVVSSILCEAPATNPSEVISKLSLTAGIAAKLLRGHSQQNDLTKHSAAELLDESYANRTNVAEEIWAMIHLEENHCKSFKSCTASAF